MFSLFYIITGNVVLAKYILFDFGLLSLICAILYLFVNLIKTLKK